MTIFKKWIDENGPDGVAKLAIGSGVSSSTIRRVRGGFVPKKLSTRLRICAFMNVSEDLLFPEVGASGKTKVS